MLSAIFTANVRVETFFIYINIYIFLPRFMFQVVHKLKGESSTGTQSHIGRCIKEVKIEHLSFFFSPFSFQAPCQKKAGAAPGHELKRDTWRRHWRRKRPKEERGMKTGAQGRF